MASAHCDTCGKFFILGAPGSSWGQYWSHEMDGSALLHDPRNRCSDCTETHGEVGTNCIGDGYAARAALADQGGEEGE